MIDVDFAKIDSIRKLFTHINQENEFIEYIQNERIQRVLKLSKLPRSKLFIKPLLIKNLI